jgi:alpha,alpha-trehalase
MNVWSFVYEGFDPGEEKLREALCTLGNGYFASRGAAPEAASDDVHYPGTYLAGGYNRLKTKIAGRVVENEDLVNTPNWLFLTFRVEGGPWFDLKAVKILSYRQELDLKIGVLHRSVHFEDAQGRQTRVESRRLVHMARAHLAALETTWTAVNWEGRLEVRSALDGTVVNGGVDRYKDLNSRHLEPLETGEISGEAVFLKVRTSQSGLTLAQAARTRPFQKGRALSPEREVVQKPGYIGHQFALELDRGGEVWVEKIVALYTSRDHGISECGLEACQAVERAASFDDLIRSQTQVYNHLWRRFDVEFQGKESQEEEATGLILHLYMFHLLQTISVNTMAMGLDVGIPSRGWHGEAYRGHIFWDELFIFPIFNLRLPEITRAVLMYRYRRLDEARLAARKAGYRGAMYPWQSGSNGREESQEVHLNPNSGRWIPDNTRLQRHVNAAIAYNIWQYFQVTNDMEFMLFYGAEMLLEIARFWSSIATYNPELERYEILRIMGPDEYHDRYPDSDRPGLNNNAYTNIMAVWVLSRALQLLDLLPEDRLKEFCQDLDLQQEEFDHWRDITRKMRVVFHGDGIISQFEGYDRLEEFDWEGYREKYGDIQRLDRVLEAEGDTPNRYKASKQADVLMLFYLFSSETLAEIFEELGYPFKYETIPNNIDYYLKRTSHGSTLSRMVHSWVLARSDRARSWKLFREALQSDVSDIQGGTTPEGIHLGAMAGTLDILKRGYMGIEPRGDILYLNPSLPEALARLGMQVRYRGHSLQLIMTPEKFKISTLRKAEGSIQIGFKDQVFELNPLETKEIAL